MAGRAILLTLRPLRSGGPDSPGPAIIEVQGRGPEKRGGIYYWLEARRVRTCQVVGGRGLGEGLEAWGVPGRIIEDQMRNGIVALLGRTRRSGELCCIYISRRMLCTSRGCAS